MFTSRVNPRTSTSKFKSRSRFTIVASATAFALAAAITVSGQSAREPSHSQAARHSQPARAFDIVSVVGARPAAAGRTGASTVSAFALELTVRSIQVGAESRAIRAREIAWRMMRRFSWRPRFQFRYLKWLWQRESSWNVYATNPYSGAYGIPQAAPGWKMASAGPHWQRSPWTQIRWGLRYIRSRYGSPRAAWDHEVAYGWY